MYQTLYGLLLKIASDDRAEVMSGMNEVSERNERRERRERPIQNTPGQF